MSTPYIVDLFLDDANIDKAWEHGVRDIEMLEILDGLYSVVPNRKTGSAPYLLIGKTAQGRCITMPIVDFDGKGTWRPTTAWPSKPPETAHCH